MIALEEAQVNTSPAALIPCGFPGDALLGATRVANMMDLVGLLLGDER